MGADTLVVQQGQDTGKVTVWGTELYVTLLQGRSDHLLDEATKLTIPRFGVWDAIGSMVTRDVRR